MPAWELKKDKSVLAAYKIVACCQRFFVIIVHLTIVLNLANVDRMICSDVEIGIFAAIARLASSRVVKPKRTIFNVLFVGSGLIDALINDGNAAPLKSSQALLVFSLKDFPERKVSAAQ